MEKKKSKYKYPGFSVYYRAEKRKWYAEIQRLNAKTGPKRKYFSADTEKEVAKAAMDFLKNEKAQYDGKETVAEYMRKWFSLVGGQGLKETSYVRKDTAIENNVIPRIGMYPITKITAEDIQGELINSMVDDGYSYSTVKKAYEATNACFRYACKPSNQHVPFNPMEDVVMPTKDSLPPKEKIAFTEEESILFRQVCLSKTSTGKYQHPKGPLFLFLLGTGMRLGEALALRWKDINFDTEILSVSKNVVYTRNRKTGTYIYKEQSTPKTKKSCRVLPMSPEIQTLLLGIREKSKYNLPVHLVFSSSKGSFLQPNNLLRTFRIICARAEIRKGDIHSLRHTFATSLIRNGVDVSIVSALLGHSSISITYDTYVHVINEQKAIAMRKIFKTSEKESPQQTERTAIFPPLKLVPLMQKEVKKE